MAGQEVGSLYYDLDINDKNLKSQLSDADKAVKDFGDRIGQHWDNSVAASKKFMLAVGAAGAAVVGFGVTSVKAFQESENVIAQTNAVLKSTGEVAGVTADAVTKLASALERQTKFSDEDVRSVENLLLTFTAIGKDIFPQATSMVLDMATALGEDTKSAAIQLGKALQDPILGVTALRRVGVNFNESQQEVINNLVNTGRSAEAQRLIMAELTREFGGSAVAAGDTFSGSLEKLKNQFNNLQEVIGGAIVQALTPLMEWVSAWVDKVTAAGGLMAYLTDLFNQHRSQIELIAGAIAGALIPAVISLTIAFGGLVLELAPFMLVGAALFYLWENNRTLFWLLTAAVIGFAVGITIALMPAIIAATVAFGGMAVAVIAATWPFVLIGVIIAGLALLIVHNFEIIKAAIGSAMDYIQTLPGRILGAVSGFGSLLYNAGRDLIQGLINGIRDMVGHAVDAVKNIGSSIINGIKGILKIFSPSAVFHELGQNVGQGLADGINASQAVAMQAIGNLSASVLAPAVSIAGGGSEGGSTNIAHSGPVINIGTVQDRQDADYIMRRAGHDQMLEGMGISPVTPP